MGPHQVVYFCDFTRSRILQCTPEGRVSVLVENEKDEAPSVPHHLSIDARGNMHTASDRGGQIWRITPEGKARLMYPPPGVTGYKEIGAGGDPFALDDKGFAYGLYVREGRPTRIVRLTPGGGILKFAGGAAGMIDGKGDRSGLGELHGSTFVCGPQCSLFLTDSGTAVRRVDEDGTVTTLAGSARPGFADGMGPAAKFNGAMGLARDTDGNLYVADTLNHRIRKLTPESSVTTLAGTGKPGATDGPAAQAKFDNPSGVTVGTDGTVYVLEFTGHEDKPRVRKITPQGNVSTLCTVK